MAVKFPQVISIEYTYTNGRFFSKMIGVVFNSLQKRIMVKHAKGYRPDLWYKWNGKVISETICEVLGDTDAIGKRAYKV